MKLLMNTSTCCGPCLGLAYNDDNSHVYHVYNYKDLLLNTKGYIWFHMSPEGDGCAVHLLLHTHYLGTKHTAHRAAEAKAKLDKLLHYKAELLLSFEKYSTQLFDYFEMLEDNNQGYSEAQKVKRLSSRVWSQDAEVVD